MIKQFIIIIDKSGDCRTLKKKIEPKYLVINAR